MMDFVVVGNLALCIFHISNKIVINEILLEHIKIGAGQMNFPLYANNIQVNSS